MLTRVLRVATIAVLIPTVVFAQARDDERRGLRAGSFRIQPAITIGTNAQSNVFIEDSNTDASLIFTISPQLNIVSNWNRHGLRLTLGAEYGAYSVSIDENYFDYSAELAGVLDITRSMKVIAKLGYEHGHEARGTDDIAATLLATSPVETDTFKLDLSGDAAFGRFKISPFGTFTYLNYDDVASVAGGVQNNDDRDRTELELGISMEYGVLRGYSIFIEPTFLRNDYKDAVDDSGINRDSEGFRVLAGAKVDLSRLLEASIGVGYTQFSYDDPAVQDFSGLALEVGGVWSIGPRTQLNFDLSRTVTETTIAGASRGIENAANLFATYELLRTVTLNASLGYRFVEYEGVAREENLVNAGFGLEWRLGRKLTLSPSYGFQMRTTTAAGLDYRNHTIGANATYRF